MTQGDQDWRDADKGVFTSGDDEVSWNGKQAKRRLPRKMTEKRLHNIALTYLNRYETSEAGFRSMLERRVAKAARAHGEDPTQYQPMIESEVAACLEAGVIDNKRFAENQVYQQRSRGASARAIQARLKSKGVSDDLIHHALDTDERDDVAAAERYAQRRRLGPYRIKDRAAKRERDVAALCRAGFSFSLAAKIIDADLNEGSP